MTTIPVIDSGFNLEEAISSIGFLIDEKDGGACVAMKRLGGDDVILIEFYQAFISSCQIDMKVMREGSGSREVLFCGVAPTNRRDFDVLFQLLFPSDEFQSSLSTSWAERQM